MPKFNPHIGALPIHICQKMGYDWIVSDVGWDKFAGKRVLDFGANGYPFIALLAKWGAEAHWTDRDPKCAATMAKLAAQWGVTLREHKLGTGTGFDIIIASNAIQHNHDGAGKLYRRLRDSLADNGRLCAVEALAHGKSEWNDRRPDPCWHRTLEDHAALWRDADLRLVLTRFFTYDYRADGSKETAEWIDPVNGDMTRAVRVCARLERT